MPLPVTQVSQKIYATSQANGQFTIDSIMGLKTLDENTKTAMVKMLDGLMGKVNFPEKTISIGDTFTQELPLNIPVAGSNMPMNAKIVYKLARIENNNACFDLTETIDLNMSGGLMKMNGTGTGSMVYDIAKSYPVSNKSRMLLSYSMNMASMPKPMEGNMQMNNEVITVISPN